MLLRRGGRLIMTYVTSVEKAVTCSVAIGVRVRFISFAGETSESVQQPLSAASIASSCCLPRLWVFTQFCPSDEGVTRTIFFVQ